MSLYTTAATYAITGINRSGDAACVQYTTDRDCLPVTGFDTITVLTIGVLLLLAGLFVWTATRQPPGQ